MTIRPLALWGSAGAPDRRRALALGAVGVGALSLLAACSGYRSTALADGPVWKHYAGQALALEFSRQLIAPSRKDGEPYERGQPELDVANKRVFVGSSDGGLYALHANSGETIWRFQTASYVQSRPLYAADEDAIYFGSHDGALYKLEARSGKLIWRLSTNAEVARRPLLDGTSIYFANANDTLVAADRKTGQILWNYHRTPAAGMEVAGYSGPALGGSLLYMGFSDGMATAVDKQTGEERWQPVDLAAEAEEARGEVPKYLDVDTTPLVTRIQAGNVAIFGSYEGGVFALDADLGTQIWSNTFAFGVSDLELWEQPSYQRDGKTFPARRIILVSTGTQGLWALDPDTGEEIWRRDLPQGGVSQPVPIAGAILIGSSKLGLYLLSPVDGSLI
ncbi:MAG TPA: PQQ-binding-like beta-propeller repeat protein, partial [Polyangiaceae bacterium]|nr:PQQ-binding-like beta-propeller repeat protein [Polyangiaceae bacterium]